MPAFSSLKKHVFMKNKGLICLILALLCPVFMLGQNVSIVGKTNIPNALVRLLTYDEMFTREQTKLAETQSDKDGKFTLRTDIKEIKPAQIAINLERVDIILKPNGNYDFEIIIPEKGEGSYFEKEQPVLKINSIDDDGFYSQYIAVQSFVDDFLYDNFDKIFRGRKTSLLDTLDNQLVRNAGKIENDYIKDFVKYRKASVLMTINTKKTISEYFDNQNVLYSQAAYMDVFFELFKGNVMPTDFLSRNPQLAELIQMQSLRKSYYANSKDKNTIFNELKTIENSSKYQKNKVVAKNVAKQLNELAYDSKAPSFSLKDKNGNTIKLSDYQNDMVLLQFVDTYSPLMEHEFSTLKDLQKQWNDTIQVVTIATKESFESYIQLFEKQGFEWQLLNLGDNILLLEDYHVKTYPAYGILKSRGRIGMTPAPSPDRFLDKQVRRISKHL